MRETSEDLAQLQALLNSSIEQAGSFLRRSFQMPEHSLSATQLVHYLQGIQNVAFASVTSRGEPRVAPIGSLFYRGRFYIPTTTSAMRTKHVQKHPAVSLTHFVDNDLAIIVHGTATILLSDHPDFATIEELQRAANSQSVRDWGEGAYIQVNATMIYTFARNPDQFPEQ
ncbi:MAG TPA: pyridoxamine 5'-phosphate oxidase family protein [Ktedonobacteraceae bacterium]|nr:pyridoxamine 5'-phosphate oxidase family protein [Ktedonobacteraceae bacterium]